jgi:hypothetical protein
MHADISYGDQHLATVEDDGKVTVVFNGTEAWECEICGEEFTEEGDADGEECTYAECAVHTGDENCDDHECSFPHDLAKTTEPFSWVNHASILIDEEKDQVDLAISLGDPRGAFVMRLYRDSRDGRIRMEVPHPEGMFLHAPLKPMLSPGGYIVNESAG